MFVYPDVQQQRAKSNCDGDDDDVQIGQKIFNEGQLSPCPLKTLNCNLHTQITNDQDDEESCCMKTSYKVRL